MNYEVVDIKVWCDIWQVYATDRQSILHTLASLVDHATSMLSIRSIIYFSQNIFNAIDNINYYNALDGNGIWQWNESGMIFNTLFIFSNRSSFYWERARWLLWSYSFELITLDIFFVCFFFTNIHRLIPYFIRSR